MLLCVISQARTPQQASCFDDGVAHRNDMRVDAVQVPDQVHVESAPAKRPALALLATLEMLVEDCVLKLAEGVLLGNQPFRPVEVSGTQDTCGEPDILV